ncbi:hypothetical protein [Streptomyces roseolus]
MHEGHRGLPDPPRQGEGPGPAEVVPARQNARELVVGERDEPIQ